MGTFSPPEDANLPPNGPFQKIVIPSAIKGNAKRLQYCTSVCAQLDSPELRASKVIFIRGVLEFTEPEFAAILDKIIYKNPEPIPITVITSAPSHAGVRVINKQPYVPTPDAPTSPDGFPNHHLVDLLTQGYNPASPLPSIEDIFDILSARRARSLYCYNISLDHLSSDFEGYLNNDPIIRTSQVDPSQNRLVGIMPGINRSFFYFASQYASGEMHIEDSLLKSLNLLYGGLANQPRGVPMKLWIFVFDSRKLISVIQQYYRPANSRVHICQYIYLHKNLFLSITFLETYGIPYHTFYQYAGDLVFIQYRVFHQVINLSPNLAEAINFADGLWNYLIPHVFSCTCENIPFVLISPNPDADVTYVTRQLDYYPCSSARCEFFSRSPSSLLQHSRAVHGQVFPILASNERWCLACNHRVLVNNASEHIKGHLHLGKLPLQFSFSAYSRFNLGIFIEKKKHLPVGWNDTAGFGLLQCRYCKEYQLAVEHSHHAKTCKTKPYYCDAPCPYTFETKHGLSRHIRAKHA
ncbi:hypothetical protein QAD02_000675 [Eretmocerus hayati]|uniref:Uncharacterized protein n=1 Tax=Eretmocerus hayati TaxID=131215 RepID=A0ACC2NFI0_9HYME|nr:hypothetical protein QAD02_000675 [Eretmocerus hayati]